MVRELGMAAGQGYLLARPMPQPNLTSIDLDALEAGGAILDRRLVRRQAARQTPPTSDRAAAQGGLTAPSVSGGRL